MPATMATTYDAAAKACSACTNHSTNFPNANIMAVTANPVSPWLEGTLLIFR